MRTLLVSLLAILSALLFGCEPGKHRPIDVYLTVESDYGSPNPPVGSNYLNYGMTITASVGSPVSGLTGTRYVCTGWTGAGSVPPAGDTNLCQFTITQNSSITWLWKIQYELTLQILPEGSGSVELSPAGEDSYYDDGEVVTLTAAANSGYVFGNWSGDLSGSDNPESLIMNGPRTVTANFLTLVLYVDGTNGDDTNDGLSWETAVKTVQTGLDKAPDGWMVIVADDTYAGTGNKDLDFGGKAIHLKSVGGAENCIIDCEDSGRGFYFHSGETNASVVEGFTIQNGSSDYGGALYCRESSPTFTNCIITSNTVTGLDSCGGGIYCYYYSSPTFNNCTISGNSVDYYGGGVCCYWYSSATFTNCTISGNWANSSGEGGGIYCYSSSPTFRNSIIWGNSAPSARQIYVSSGCFVILSYSCYANGTNDVAGAGQVNSNNHINDDPQFVDAANGNYHLQATSPCIDIGNNSYVPAGVSTDLDGNPRIQNGTVDLGAYEYQP